MKEMKKEIEQGNRYRRVGLVNLLRSPIVLDDYAVKKLSFLGES